MTKRLACLILCAILVIGLMPALVQAETFEAEDITALAEISPRSPKHGLKSISDRNYTTPWETAAGKNPYVQAVLPEDKPCAFLYICFGRMPAAFEVQKLDGDKWVTLVQGDTRFLHTFIQLPNPVTRLRIAVTDKKKTSLLLNELFLFGIGKVPGWVQKWEPTGEKADLLVLAAHPDDELLFMGGTIPHYAVSLHKRVVTCYLTPSNTTRSSELLNGLWSMGVRTYPLIGPFGDRYSGNLKDGYDKWGGKAKVRAYVMGVIRKLKPAVIVTHDTNGEYGHGAHQVCADAAIYSVEHGADPSADPASFEQYGAWDVSKLYLHLYPENGIVMDWRTSDPALSGRSPLQAAKDAYAFHVTQQNAGTAVIGKDFKVTDEGEFSCSRFGLYRSLVGPDVQKNDFFENIP
jgi:LmbE family N-acetylglucosaminyl deacetylase